MAPEDKEVLVYYLGYPDVSNPHTTVVKGNHYLSPTKPDGTLDIGGAIRVRSYDLDEFLQKNEYQRKGDPTKRNAYTIDPTLAGLAKTKGSALEAPARMTTTEALGLVDDETLEKLLESRKSQRVTATPAVNDPNSEGEPVNDANHQQ